jgi:hypothetical protein
MAFKNMLIIFLIIRKFTLAIRTYHKEICHTDHYVDLYAINILKNFLNNILFIDFIVPFCYVIPVYNIPPSRNVVRSFVLVFEIICMFPYVTP